MDLPRTTHTNPDGTETIQFFNVCKDCGAIYPTGVNLDRNPEVMGRRSCVECVMKAERR